MTSFRPSVRIRCASGLPHDVEVLTADGGRVERVTRIEWIVDSKDNAPHAVVHILASAFDVVAEPTWVLDPGADSRMSPMPLRDAGFTADQLDAIREMWAETVLRIAAEKAAAADTIVRYRALYGPLPEEDAP